jgi:hypothetical protein
MWDWFATYPSVQVEDIATPYVKGEKLGEKIATFDYIVVGGNAVV